MIPLSVPHFSGHEWAYVKECLDTGWVSSGGAFVGRFENEIATYTGAGHAVACAMKMARTMRPDQSLLVNLSGRGDKDIGTVADLSGADFYDRPSMRGLSVKGGSKESS